MNISATGSRHELLECVSLGHVDAVIFGTLHKELYHWIGSLPTLKNWLTFYFLCISKNSVKTSARLLVVLN